MRRASLLSSGAFRFALLIATVFAIGAAALLLVVEQSVARYTVEAAEDSVNAEADILAAEDAGLGRAELIRAIDRHARAVRERQLRYLLIDPSGRRVTGTLPAAAAASGWQRIAIRDPGDPEQSGRSIPLLALSVRLSDGAVLVVASDLSDLVDLRHRLRLFTIAFGGLISLLALVGGLIVGSLFLRRLESVNRAIAQINGGRFAERLPPIGMGPEFDRLSANLNSMLDRIEALLDSLRQVSTDIAHDLRTPLTRLRQRLECIRDVGEDLSLPEQLDAALSQIDEILALFGALLRIGSLEGGTRILDGVADLSELVDRIGQAYAPVAEDSGHELEVAVAPGVTVTGDAELLAQAVTNLVENALTHTPPGSRVSLVLTLGKGGAQLMVADDGPGVPEHERDKVIRRFYRMDRSRHTPGAGLGLALVSAIAVLHGSAVILEDNRPGLRVVLRFSRLAAGSGE
ncbi:MAG: hypothetical protein JWL91_2340 [Sphingomonas bacterium]|nr:ATP-binding protein [Sphingomonas bacterium]MDB5690464.1 hypothetical protein [Sphingomonas bacterium]